MNVQDIRLDIDKKTGVAQWVTIGQGDKGGTTIRATVFDNDVAAVLTGMSARFEMRMPNATYFEDTNCTINGNVITYVVDESHAALYAGGESVAYFALYDGETAIYSTERFHVRVARAASDGANPGHAWTNGIEEWLDEASDTLDDAVADASSRVGATINAANAAVEGMRSDVDEAISDTEEVIDRAEDAIDAMGDISELAVPLMSADIRGGAKLEEHGGLALRDGALGIGSLVQESDGYARGGLAEVTAKGHAEQVSTTGKNLVKYPFYSGSKEQNGLTFTMRSDQSIRINGTPTGAVYYYLDRNLTLAAGTYTFSLVASIDSEHFAVYYSGRTVYSNGSGRSFTLSEEVTGELYIFTNANLGAIDVTVHPQLELGSTATAYEPYTGGAPSPSPDYPQEIQVVRGRNLLDVSSKLASNWSLSGNTISKVNNIGYWMGVFANTAGQSAAVPSASIANLPTIDSGTYTFRCERNGTFIVKVFAVASNGAVTALAESTNANPSVTFTVNDRTAIELRVESNQPNVTISNIQLNLGSTPQPYVPYGYVGMEARDPDTDELISCTAIPLPSRGWVADLPDGTADSLRLDGAGKCEWELETNEVVLDGTVNAVTYNSTGSMFQKSLNDMKAQSAQDILFNGLSNRYIGTTSTGEASWSKKPSGLIGTRGTTKNLCIKDTSYDNASDYNTWLSTHNVTVLYPLATPVTEDCGYVKDWPTDIPEGATLSIRELDSVGIKYFIDSSVTELAKQWYARANSEYEDRLQALEEAMATIITGS